MSHHRINVYRSNFISIQHRYICSIIRPASLGFAVGEIIEFHEQMLDNDEFTARTCKAVIKQIDAQFKGLVKGYCTIHFNLC